MRNTTSLTSSPQRGSVLLICLILLIAVTLLGISSMNTTMVEHRIVSNTRSQTLALAGAEAALNEAAEMIQSQSGPQNRDGLRLGDIQENDAITDRSNLNALVNNVTVNLNDSGPVSIPLWGSGAVTNNPNYLDSSSRKDWWSNSANTNGLSNNLSNSSSNLEENNYHLAENPRYVIEKGQFIPDDLSPGAMAEYRGRQEFIAISRSTGSSENIESSLQATVVTRFR